MTTRRGKDRRRREVNVPADRRRTGSDRRVHARVMVDIEVDYKSADNFLFAYITDISAMGIFIRTNAPEPPGTVINLRSRSAANAMQAFKSSRVRSGKSVSICSSVMSEARYSRTS